ncbi:MAG TPA: LuxR C-terminal-related transcriptional regulator [Ktedonobacteraceae bacterium]|nr:LuxR C-terminal-related transcriptional regulator [Ktedonobacteraceae bacterium]
MEKRYYNNSYRAFANGPSLLDFKKGTRPLLPEDEEIPQARSPHLLLAQYLPTPLTPLVGREQEIGAICALLQQPDVRLLTLTGPGGVGKTRLALQIPAEVFSTFTDGICFVSLASINDIDQVLPAIAQALGLNEKHFPRSLGQVQAVMRDKHFLLILDNFEQLVDAAPQLKELLTACPYLKILTTSRAVLGLREEQEFYVTPLALPDLTNLSSCEDLSQVASVCFFLQRVRTIRPDFILTDDNARIIAQICVRLDGLPLALELAAARLKLFSPQSLLARLDHRLTLLTGSARDLPERQQTLRKTMEWSYSLLSPEEQRLFHRLSVFADGCSLQTIEAVCNTLARQDEPLLNAIASLLNQSLLQREPQPQIGQGEERFRMLETTREYALECLQNSGEEEEVRQAHAEYYLALIQSDEREALAGETTDWIERIESEFENLLSALNWFLSSRNGEQTLETHEWPWTMCLVGMGASAALRKQYSQAARLWGKAKALSQTKKGFSRSEPYTWSVTSLSMHPRYSQAIETARTQLGEQVFSALVSEGQALSLAQLLTGPEPQAPATALTTLAHHFHTTSSDRLTPRERDVLRLLAQGMKSALIAEELVIGLVTVNSHVRTIYSKLGVSSRSAATRYALEHHLI